MRSGVLLRVWVPFTLLAVLCVGGAAAYVARVPRHYRAEAELLVTPVADNDERYAGLPVLRAPAAVGEAAHLAATSSLAEAVRARLGLRESAADVLDHVRVRPLASSSVVEIVATSSDPAEAVRLANSFAELVVAQRTATLNTAILDATTRTFDHLVALPSKSKAGARGIALRSRLAQLRSLSRSSDPSLRVSSQALGAAKARPAGLWIVLGALGGALLLGLMVAALASRRPRQGREYDLAVADQVVTRLEERLAERIEALLAEQERLVAREAELAERERALASGDAAAGEARRRELEERVKAVTARELELVKRAGSQAAAEKSLEAHELDLGARRKELESRQAELEAREQELEAHAEELKELAREQEARGAELEARSADLETRSEELETRSEELQTRADELERRAAEIEERPAAAPAWQPVAVVPPPAAVAANVSALPQRPGRWNLTELARLVEERGPEHPERQDEWQSYLFFLRSYAEPDGTIPDSFDWLIEETFGELTSIERAPAG